MKLSEQMKRHNAPKEKPFVLNEHTEEELEGNIETMISTGSTLLDLAICGGRKRGGGIPGGIFVEVFGPSGAGKTVLLCEIAGDIKRKGGSVRFDDPESRLNTEFSKLFDLRMEDIEYSTPDKVTEVFENIRNWEPKTKTAINGTFTDSLAALSTDMEMDNDDGDKMGMRRAKEFSEGFRKNARILKEKNYVMVASNQVRDNQDAANKFSPKFKSTGGQAIGFYASIRLRVSNPDKIYKEVKVAGKTVKRVIGVQSNIEVFKNSTWKPYRTAPVTIIFDYGLDDIRENLQYLKDYTGASKYMIGETELNVSLDKSIALVEERGLQADLKNAVIDLWEEIEGKFSSERKKIR